jgi:hypothetical protein
MEPQYMILGEAAGVAAKLAISGGTTVQGIAVQAMVDKLRKQGAVIEYVPSPQATAIRVFDEYERKCQLERQGTLRSSRGAGPARKD